MPVDGGGPYLLVKSLEPAPVQCLQVLNMVGTPDVQAWQVGAPHLQVEVPQVGQAAEGAQGLTPAAG